MAQSQPFTLSLFGREILRFGRSTPNAGAIQIPTQGPMGSILGGLGANRFGFPYQRDKAQKLAAYTGYVHSCVSARAQRDAAALYQLIDKRTGDVVPEDALPIPYAFFRRPNPVMSEYALKVLISTWLNLCGTAPVLKVRNAAGVPIMQWPLLPNRVTALYDPDEWVRYEYLDDSGKIVKIPGRDMIFYRWPHPTKLFDGIGPLEGAGLFADTDALLWNFQREMFSKGPFSSWILQYPETAHLEGDQAQNIAESFEQIVGDREHPAYPVVLGQGVEAKQFPTTNKGLEVPTINEEVKERIRSAFHVSKTILGEVPGESRANVEGAEYGFYQFTKSYLRLIDEENERSVLPEWDERLAGDFDLNVPADKAHELAEEMSRLDRGVLTINEVRQDEGWEPVEWGDEPHGPMFSVPLELTPPDDTPPSAPEPGDSPAQKSQRADAPDPQLRREAIWRAFIAMQGPVESKVLAIVRQQFKRHEAEVLRRIEEKVPRFLVTLAGWTRKHAEDHFAARSELDDIADLTDFAEDMIKPIRPQLVTLYTAAGKKAVQSVGKEGLNFVVNDLGIKKIANHLTRSTDVVLKTSADAIKATLKEGFLKGEGVGELSGRIRDLYDGMSRGRAEMIARTETVAPANLGAVEGYKQSGVERKEWITTMDGNERDTHGEANGQIVPLESDFSVGGENIPYPGEGSAENVINCRCTIAGVFDESQGD